MVTEQPDPVPVDHDRAGGTSERHQQPRTGGWSVRDRSRHSSVRMEQGCVGRPGRAAGLNLHRRLRHQRAGQRRRVRRYRTRNQR